MDATNLFNLFSTYLKENGIPYTTQGRRSDISVARIRNMHHHGYNMRMEDVVKILEAFPELDDLAAENGVLSTRRRDVDAELQAVKKERDALREQVRILNEALNRKTGS